LKGRLIGFAHVLQCSVCFRFKGEFAPEFYQTSLIIAKLQALTAARRLRESLDMVR
jgi:hypothetical protein